MTHLFEFFFILMLMLLRRTFSSFTILMNARQLDAHDDGSNHHLYSHLKVCFTLFKLLHIMPLYIHVGSCLGQTFGMINGQPDTVKPKNTCGNLLGRIKGVRFVLQIHTRIENTVSLGITLLTDCE